jgi:hypothetical protein
VTCEKIRVFDRAEIQPGPPDFQLRGLHETRDEIMAEPTRVNRPLSPHLQVYRPQLTSITSILTRITGNALIVAS